MSNESTRTSRLMGAGSTIRDLRLEACVLGISLSLLVVMVGCPSAGMATTPATPPPAVRIVLGSAPSSLTVGQTFQFTATVSNATNTAVTWSVGGVAGGNSTYGTITGSGLSVTYNAPSSVPTPATFDITATSVADDTKSASVSMTITSAAAVVVSITSPSSPASVTVGGTLGITASVTGTSNTVLTWTVAGSPAGTVTNGNSTIGTITGPTATSVRYNAPAALPTGNNPVTITATSQADPSKSASITVTINPSGSGPNAINVTGGGTDATGVNLDISTSSPTLGLADIGTCTGTFTPTVNLPNCSAGVASVTISRGSTAIVWLLGQGLTNGSGTALANGLAVSVSQGSTSDVAVSLVSPLSIASSGLTNIVFQIQVSANATAGPRNIVVTNGAGELQAFIGAMQIQ